MVSVCNRLKYIRCPLLPAGASVANACVRLL
jgi:hypothetical protein